MTSAYVKSATLRRRHQFASRRLIKPRRWRSLCSCGWEGPDFATREQTIRAWGDHLWARAQGQRTSVLS